MADRYLLESGAPDGYLLEDGTGVLLLEVPATPVDDGEGWWSGAAMSFAAVAVAGAAALLSTNVAVARTFVHQDEVPAAAATPASATSSIIPTQRARVSPVFHQWYAQDELPVQAATPVVDEVYDWKPLVPTAVVRAFGDTPQWDDQALSWKIDEQYNWTPGWGTSPAARINAPLLGADEDIVPSVAPASALDGSDFTVDVGPAPAANVVVWAEDEQIVPQPTFRPEESDAPSLVTILARIYGLPQIDDQDWVPSAVATAPPEDDSAPALFPVATKVHGLLPVFDSEWTPAAPPEESEAPTFITIPARIAGPMLLGDDDLVQFVAPTFPPEETDAPVFVAPLVKPNVPLLLGIEDEWIQFVAPPIAIDQSDFTVDVGPAPAANVIVWAEDEQIVPQPTFGLEEFESPLFVPALVKANAPLWFGDDERITFVAPTPTFEDDSWNILRSVPVDLAPYSAMLFQGSTDDGSIVVTEPPPPPTGTHTWLLVKRRTRR